MKTVLVCVIFFSQFAAQGRDLTPVKSPICPSARVTVLPRSRVIPMGRYPAPVAEMTTNNGPTVGGVAVRVSTAPEPARMFSPTAPPEYGSAWDLVSFTTDPNRTDNPNKPPQLQPNGLRLLTFGSIW